MGETTCPVFRPTEQEFKSFRRYIEDVVDPIAGKVGLCKIIPPPGWAARRRDAAEELCKSVYIPAPIRQCVSSTRSNGVYSVHVVENPPMSLAEFKVYADKRAPFPSSTASAGCPGSAAVGVRRGRSSGSASPPGADSDGGGGGGGYGSGYGVGYGSSRGGGDSGSAGSDAGVSKGDSEIARRVRMFWRSLGPNSEAPVYGADTLGTLFAEDDDDPWNVGRLDTILQLLKANLPGITSPMLYAGMWRSMFAFHVEDVNLYSINYLHRGDPKSWYCVPPDSRQRFESLAQAFFTEEFHACKDHLRHKTSMISPLQIQKAGISYCTAVQEAGEFMITFPAAYHGGFNHGFNLAESTNFAIDRWIIEGRAAGYCRCSPHSVRIDVDRFETLVRQHRRIAGRDSTCLDGLAEVRGGVYAHERRSSKPEARWVASTSKKGREAASASCRLEKPEVRSKGEREEARRGDEEPSERGERTDDEVEEEEDEEDVQVFQCVCSNVRAVRRWRRSREGLVIPLPAAKGDALWPEGETTECPRCGVWGHTACLEYVVPPQFVDPTDETYGIIPPPPLLPPLPASSLTRGGNYDAGVEDSSSSTTAEKEPEEGVDRPLEAALAGAEVVITESEAHSAASVPRKSEVDARSDVHADTALPKANGRKQDTLVQPAPAMPIPRPVCWRCMQERAEVAAAAAAAAAAAHSGGGGGGIPMAAPRRAAKATGGSSNRRSSAGGGPSVRVHSTSSGGRKGGTKTKVGGGKAAKWARPPESSRSGTGGTEGDKKTRKSARGTGGALETMDVVVPKKGRIGPRLLGKTVLVSDGVAAVLTGVITAIEDGQARVHYKGRKAKLDEWIEIHSERFLSAAEASQQIQLARLAMHPAASASEGDAVPPTQKGKKRKASEGPSGSPNSKDKRAREGDKDTKIDGKGRGKSVGKAKGGKTRGNIASSEEAGSGKKGKRPPRSTSVTENKAARKKLVRDVSAERGSDGVVGDVKTRRLNISRESKKPVTSKRESAEKAVKKPTTAKKSKETATNKKPSKSKDNEGAESGKVVPKPKVKKGSRKELDKDKGKKAKGARAAKLSASAAAVPAVAATKTVKRKRAPDVSVKPIVIPPPVVVRKEAPQHHVISNRRAAVLARTFAKETEEAKREHAEAVAAAERSRAAREQRLKASVRRAELAAVGSPRGPAAAGTARPRGPSSSAPAMCGGSAVKENLAEKPSGSSVVSGEQRWADRGFGDRPWGMGPYFPRDETAAAPRQIGGKAPSSVVQGAEAPALGHQREGDSGSRAQGVAEYGDIEFGTEPAGDSAQLESASEPRRNRRRMHRARVDAGEAVDLGDPEAFREWLKKLRAVQEIPVGHVERCCRVLAVLLGTAPADGSVRASLRAMLVAEALRGGASTEVAKRVRLVASVMADAASRAGLPQNEEQTIRHAPGNSGSSGSHEEKCNGDTGGVVSDPAAKSIRDMEGAAAYAHALAHVIRSGKKQRSRFEEEAAVPDARSPVTEASSAGSDTHRSRGKKVKASKKAVWTIRRLQAAEQAHIPPPSSRLPPPDVVGSIPGRFSFSHAGSALLAHAKAMVGLKRAHRWAKAWLTLQKGSSVADSSRCETYAPPSSSRGASAADTSTPPAAPVGGSGSVVGLVRSAALGDTSSTAVMWTPPAAGAHETLAHSSEDHITRRGQAWPGREQTSAAHVLAMPCNMPVPHGWMPAGPAPVFPSAAPACFGPGRPIPVWCGISQAVAAAGAAAAVAAAWESCQQGGGGAGTTWTQGGSQDAAPLPSNSVGSTSAGECSAASIASYTREKEEGFTTCVNGDVSREPASTNNDPEVATSDAKRDGVDLLEQWGRKGTMAMYPMEGPSSEAEEEDVVVVDV